MAKKVEYVYCVVDENDEIQVVTTTKAKYYQKPHTPKGICNYNNQYGKHWRVAKFKLVEVPMED